MMKTANIKDLCNLTLLNRVTIQPYLHLTYPLWRTRLQQTESEESTIAIGVEIDSQPVGLAIAELVPHTDKAQILSIYVKPENRQQGIGGSLLRNLSQKLQTLGCRQLELGYTAQTNSTVALEKLLSQQGWSIPQPKMLVCHSITERMQQAPWLYSAHLPATFSIFPLIQLTNQEYQIIQQQQTRDPWYPEILSPFRGDLPVEPLNSLGLRYQGQVVGWMATHRIAPDTIRYTNLFVRQDLQKMGRAIPLIAEAIKLQLKSNIPRYTCAAEVGNKPMVKFVRRRLQPFLTQVRESRQSHKLLSN
jgi:N-acetylglutamate synthase-like GNAT family acetyltransferase